MSNIIQTKENASSSETSIPRQPKIPTPSKIPTVKKSISLEAFIFLGIFIMFFGSIAKIMGGVNMMNTLMKTAYALLMETVFYIMAIAVLAGALSSLLSEFGIISLINKILSPLMKPLYDLPGATTLGVLTCYMSDNPAILTFANDKEFKRYFKKYQLPALTNIGTSFGMGLIITTFIISITSPLGENFGIAALVGNIGAILGSIVSTRLMLQFSKKVYEKDEWCIPMNDNSSLSLNYRTVRKGKPAVAFLNQCLQEEKTVLI